MIEDKVKKYLDRGGELFTIKNIYTIRDGGTVVIETFNTEYYIHKNNKTFHSDYPTDNNLITDEVFIDFMLIIINSYLYKCEQELRRNHMLLSILKEKN